MTGSDALDELADHLGLSEDEPEPVPDPLARSWNPRRAVTETVARVADLAGAQGEWPPELNPNGQWVRVRDDATRKVWRGYGRYIVLRTTLTPGTGWWAFQSDPAEGNAFALFPDDGEYIVDASGVPIGMDSHGADRAELFAAVQRYMTELANSAAGRDTDGFPGIHGRPAGGTDG